MKLRAFLYAAASLMWIAVPMVAMAAGLLPVTAAGDCGNASTAAQACNICAFGSLIQNIINFAIGLSIPVAAILFSYAGWLYFTNRENTSKIEQAHKIFSSVLIGFAIAVAGWLIVQTILKTLAPGYQSWTTFTCNATRPMDTNLSQLFQQSGLPNVTTVAPVPSPVLVQNYNGSAGGAVVCQTGSTWSQGALNCVDSSGEITAPAATAPPLNSGCPAGATLDPSGYNCQVCSNDGYNDNGSAINQTCETVAPNPPLSNTDCSAETIQAAASSGGYNLTASQAQTLSCIAVPESACGRNTSTATTPSGQVTSATGMFQIVMGYSDNCHSLNIPACTQAAQAAGYNINGNLNCSQHFSGGRPTDQQGIACQAAAANITCNASAAACLVQANNGKFTDWTADSRSSLQGQCIQRYAN